MTRSIATGRTIANRRRYSFFGDGVDDSIQLNRESAYNLSTFSVEFWVKAPSGQTTKRIFTEGRSTTTSPVLIISTGTAAGSADKLNLFLRNDAGTILLSNVTSTSAVFNGTWHHVVYVDAAGTVTLYVDKQADATNFNYTRSTLTLDRSTLGALSSNGVVSSWFAGQIAQFRIYNKALSLAEVTHAYNNSASIPRVNLLTELLFLGSPTTNAANTGHRSAGWTIVGSPTFSTDMPTRIPALGRSVATTGRGIA